MFSVKSLKMLPSVMASGITLANNEIKRYYKKN